MEKRTEYKRRLWLLDSAINQTIGQLQGYINAIEWWLLDDETQGVADNLKEAVSDLADADALLRDIVCGEGGDTP